MTKNFCTFAVQNPRKDAGVVDRDGLENRCTLTGTQGSNPCLSAKKQPSRLLFLHLERRDENPGRVRYRAALWERSGQRLPVFPQKSSPCRLLFLVQAESSVHLILVNRRRLHPLVGSRLVATATLRNIFEHQAFICNIPPAVATGRDPTSG